MNISSRLRRIICTVAIAGTAIVLPSAPADATGGHRGHRVSHDRSHHGGLHRGHFGRHQLGHRGHHRFHARGHRGGFKEYHGGLRIGLNNRGLSIGLGHGHFSGHHRSRSYPPVSGHHDVHAVREPSMESHSWSLLRSGRTVVALGEFANEAHRHPSHGLPKIGYALATSASGDLDRGSLAMRRAMRIDPNAAHYVVLEEELGYLLDRLVKEYDAWGRTAAEPDTAFMLVSLHYLRGDIDAAHVALEHLIETGDRSASTAGLRRLVDQRQVEQTGVDETAYPSLPESSDQEPSR